MSSLQPVRGTHDILGEEIRRQRHVMTVFADHARRYGFEEIATPIFEFTDVFQRTLGETSDVVTKEMYSFEDRGGENITLRPENTAGIARAFISGGMQQNAPCRFFAAGPMFRYERPQKGRLRQFHQIDVEILGVDEPQADIEVIALAAELLQSLDILGKCTLELNTLGDGESRADYRAALVEYFSDHRDKLSEDSCNRLEKNPMRILDSKDPGDRVLVDQAPEMGDYLNAESQDFYGQVCAGLKLLGIAYQQNSRLVRGLDYYSHTAFEFVTDALGAQGAVVAGGRYNGLVKQMGGPQTAGIGWAGGIERLSMLLESPPEMARPVAIVPVGDKAQDIALKLAFELRRAGHIVDLGYRGNVGKRMKRANKMAALAAVIIGDDEIAAGQATVRDLDSGNQEMVAMADIGVWLERFQ